MPKKFQFTRRRILRGSAVVAVSPLIGLDRVGPNPVPANPEADPLAALPALMPEQFGATGRSDGDDTAAFEALFVVARQRRDARVVLSAGATYAISNPFVFGGVHRLLIEGHGARIMNVRRAGRLDTFDANFMPIHLPMPFMPNGVETLDYGPLQGEGTLDLGVRIQSVAAGSSSLSSLDGAPLPLGPAVVYGWDRYGDGGDSVPPCARYFEWVEITGRESSGGGGRLAAPLRFSYDARAPEKSYKGGAGQRYGAARLLPLNRGGGRFRANSYPERLVLRDVEFVPSAKITAPGQVNYNGVAGLGGVRALLLDNVESRGLFVAFTETAVIRESRISGNLEIDKFVGQISIENSTIGSLVGGLGARAVELLGETQVLRGTALAPTEWMKATDCTFSGDAMSPRALVGHYAYGSARAEYSGCQFRTLLPEADRLFEAQHFEARVQVSEDRKTLSLTRQEYDRSGFAKNVFIGARLYDSGDRHVATIVRMPWCPSGDLIGGEVMVGIVNGMLKPGAVTVRLPVLADVMVSSPNITGPFAQSVTTLLGTTTDVAPNSKLARVRGLEIGEKSVIISSDALPVRRAGAAFTVPLGQAFQSERIELSVFRESSVTPGTAGLFIGCDTSDGRDIAIFRAIDTTCAGTRVLQAASLSLSACDQAGGAFPTRPITLIRITDPTRLLPAATGRWVLKIEGKFV